MTKSHRLTMVSLSELRLQKCQFYDELDQLFGGLPSPASCSFSPLPEMKEQMIEYKETDESQDDFIDDALQAEGFEINLESVTQQALDDPLSLEHEQFKLERDKFEFEKECRRRDYELKRLEIDSKERIERLRIEKEERVERYKLDLEFNVNAIYLKNEDETP